MAHTDCAEVSVILDPAKLRQTRLTAGLSYRKLAAKIRADAKGTCSVAYLVELEQGHRDLTAVSPWYLARIAAALNVAVEDITTETPAAA